MAATQNVKLVGRVAGDRAQTQVDQDLETTDRNGGVSRAARSRDGGAAVRSRASGRAESRRCRRSRGGGVSLAARSRGDGGAAVRRREFGRAESRRWRRGGAVA
jgi:hypothetical protein